MAKDEEVEKDEGAEQDAPPKKSKLTLIIIILSVVVLLAVVTGGGYFFLSKKSSSGDKQEDAGHKTEETAQEGQGANHEGFQGAIIDLESFVVNLTDAQGTRYLKAVIQLDVSNEEVQKEITHKMPLLRDTIISLLSSKSFDDVATEPGKRELKRVLIDRINKNLKTGQVNRIYFSEFVVQ